MKIALPLAENHGINRQGGARGAALGHHCPSYFVRPYCLVWIRMKKLHISQSASLLQMIDPCFLSSASHTAGDCAGCHATASPVFSSRGVETALPLLEAGNRVVPSKAANTSPWWTVAMGHEPARRRQGLAKEATARGGIAPPKTRLSAARALKLGSLGPGRNVTLNCVQNLPLSIFEPHGRDRCTLVSDLRRTR